MTDLDSAGLSAAEKALELLHHREPHPLRSSAVREVVRAYLAALSVPSDTEKPRPSPDDYREAVVALADSPEQRTAFLRLIDDVFAAGRAAASPDPPNEEACLRWTCESCGWNVVVPMPGYAGDGHYHYERGNTPCGPLVARREGFIRARPGATLYFPAATSHGSDEGSTNPGDGPDHEPSPGAASPDERLREAVAALPQYVITIQDREGYTYERGCEGQPMNYTGVMLADVEALVGKLKDGATTARETTNELKDAAADREKPEGCRAPHCFSEYGTPCGTCPAEKPETP